MVTDVSGIQNENGDLGQGGRQVFPDVLLRVEADGTPRAISDRFPR